MKVHLYEVLASVVLASVVTVLRFMFATILTYKLIIMKVLNNKKCSREERENSVYIGRNSKYWKLEDMNY